MSRGSRDQRFSEWIATMAPGELSAVGRLDKATTGLLLLTDDGDLDMALRSSPLLQKLYMAVVSVQPGRDDDVDAFLARASEKLLSGVDLPDGQARAAIVEVMRMNAEIQDVANRRGLLGMLDAVLPPDGSERFPATHPAAGCKAAVLVGLADGRFRVVRRMLA